MRLPVPPHHNICICICIYICICVCVLLAPAAHAKLHGGAFASSVSVLLCVTFG